VGAAPAVCAAISGVAVFDCALLGADRFRSGANAMARRSATTSAAHAPLFFRSVIRGVLAYERDRVYVAGPPEGVEAALWAGNSRCIVRTREHFMHLIRRPICDSSARYSSPQHRRIIIRHPKCQPYEAFRRRRTHRLPLAESIQSHIRAAVLRLR
jgi:hypothetical protein